MQECTARIEYLVLQLPAVHSLVLGEPLTRRRQLCHWTVGHLCLGSADMSEYYSAAIPKRILDKLQHRLVSPGRTYVSFSLAPPQFKSASQLTFHKSPRRAISTSFSSAPPSPSFAPLFSPRVSTHERTPPQRRTGNSPGFRRKIHPPPSAWWAQPASAESFLQQQQQRSQITTGTHQY